MGPGGQPLPLLADREDVGACAGAGSAPPPQPLLRQDPIVELTPRLEAHDGDFRDPQDAQALFHESGREALLE